MSAKRYTEEFRIEAVKQVTDRGHPVAEVASRLGVTSHSLYQWIRRYRVPEAERLVSEDQNAELRRLKAELRRVGIEADFSLPSERLIRTLDQIIEWRGSPKVIRCDNGPENISHAVQQWAQNRSIRLEYIEPGKPQQNAYVERFNRTVRYEWLAQQLFDSIEEVQEFATQWMWNYNHERPHMALGGITPYQRRAMAA